MNIYIPVEVKVRELEGKTLLALATAERVLPPSTVATTPLSRSNQTA